MGGEKSTKLQIPKLDAMIWKPCWIFVMLFLWVIWGSGMSYIFGAHCSSCGKAQPCTRGLLMISWSFTVEKEGKFPQTSSSGRFLFSKQALLATLVYHPYQPFCHPINFFLTLVILLDFDCSLSSVVCLMVFL